MHTMSRTAGLIKGRVSAWIALFLSGLTMAPAQPATNAPAGVTYGNRPAGALSLADAQRIAFERNWDLLTAKSGIDSATAQLIMAKEFPNPTVSAFTYKIGTHDMGTTLGNGVWSRSYDTIIAINQLIEIAGKRHDRQVAGRAAILGARARFYDAKRTLDQGVTKVYLAALLAGENVRILTESSGYLQHEAEIASARLKAGDISESDEKQIEINAEQFELQARAAAATAVQARIAVETLMGVNQPKGDWHPSDSLEALVVVPAAPMRQTKGNAQRTDVLAAEADLRGGQAQLKLQKALRVPDPVFSLGYEHEPPGGGPPVDTLNFGVTFPLPLWNLNGGAIKGAQAAVDQFELALGKVRAQAVADLAAADVEYSEAHDRWLRYQDQIRPQSTKVRESVAFAYEKGGASLVDLLDAQRTDNDVRLATAQAMNDTAGAVADLKAARTVVSEAELSLHP
jgi:cobalt-zinc-cadmium efflux system outer membrane protein